MATFKNILLVFVLMAVQFASAQIGVGTSVPSASAELELYSPAKGLLIPRITLSPNLTNPSPVNSPSVGLVVFNTGENQPMGFYFWNGSAWKMISTPNAENVTSITPVSDNAVARFHGTAGKTIHNSPLLITDANDLSGANQFSLNSLQLTTNPTAGFQLISDATGTANWQPAPPVDIRKNDTLIVANAKYLNFTTGINVQNPITNEALITFFKNSVAQNVMQLSATESINLNTDNPVAIEWTTAHYKDPASFIHSETTNPSRMYVRSSGLYEVNYMFSCYNVETTRVTIRVRIRKNGTTFIPHSTTYIFAYHINNDWVTRTSTSFLIQLEANDYVELVTNRQTQSGQLLLLPHENLFFLQLVRKL
jgi:hypothetical protein